MSARTAGRYAEQVLSCTEYWRGVGVWPGTLLELDDAVAEYLEFVWAEGGHGSSARFLVAGIQHFLPSAKRHLELSWTLVRTWARMEPPTRAVPFSCEQVLALAARAVERQWSDVALLLHVGFEAMLRTGEIFGLAAPDVMFTPRGAVLQLTATKMGGRQARAEMVQIHSGITLGLLRRQLSELDAAAPLSPRKPSQLRMALRSLLDDFGLGALRFTWYSLRRGGATADFLEHGSLEATLVRGRWACGRTARIYIEQAVADSVTAGLSSGLKARLRAYASRWHA